jgi:hypothetical protein
MKKIECIAEESFILTRKDNWHPQKNNPYLLG